jgi:transaldolase
MIKPFSDLAIKIFVDTADKTSLLQACENPLVKGCTTNPSLLSKAGVTDYNSFAKEVLSQVRDKPISFEVLSDDADEMLAQAKLVKEWGRNVYVKIPIVNSRGESTIKLIKQLSADGVNLNITAILTREQALAAIEATQDCPSAFISIFAGRIADTGRDPLPLMQEAIALVKTNTRQEILWASTREFYNIYQAEQIGCHIITVPLDIIKKFALYGKDLTEYAVETVQGFVKDTASAGLTITV